MKHYNLCVNTTNASYCAIRYCNEAFNELIQITEKSSYPLDESYESIPIFIEDMINRLKNNILCSTHDAIMFLSEIGISDDIEKTVETLKTAISYMPKKIKAIFSSVDDNKTQSISKTKKILNDCRAQGIIVTEIDPTMDLTAYTDETKYKVYAVRTKYGTQEVKFYVVENPVNAELNSRAAKAQYTIDTNGNYFQTRPILYENWLKLDSYHQMQTA